MPPRSISRPGSSQVTAAMSGMDREPSRQRRDVAVVAGFPVFDAAAERDVEQAAGAGVGVEREQQARWVGLAEVEGLAGREMVDARDIAVLDEAAEAGFEEIELVEALAGHAGRDAGSSSRAGAG